MTWESKKNLVIVGSRIDGQGGVILANARESREFNVISFVDDNKDLHGTSTGGIPIVCMLEDISKFFDVSDIVAHIAIGDSAARKVVYNCLVKQNIEFVNIIDNSARIYNSVRIGTGVFVGPNAVIHNDCVIGNNVVINTAASLDHNNTIQDHVIISPGCRLGGRVTIKECAFVGIGAIILPDVIIGRNSIVGAGSVVLKSIPANSKVFGVPAKSYCEVMP